MDYEEMDDDQLIERTAATIVMEKDLREARERMEMELRHRMEDRGAREIYTPKYTCSLKPATPEHDYNKLHALREILSPEVIAEGYVPEHNETVTVAEKWDGRKFRTWKLKYGDMVAEVIDNALLPSRPPKVMIGERT